MNAKRTSSATREMILAAAAKVVSEHGAVRMTLEAVAREAGVSKGGLLYHFPNKNSLIEGMIAHMVTDLTARIRSAYEKDDFGTNQGRWLRALTQANFQSLDLDLGAGLTAAVLLNPDLLEVNREAYKNRQTLIEQDGVDVILANIIRLVGDGIWFSELLGFAPPPEPLKTQIKERLLALTTGDFDQRSASGNN